MAAVDWITIEGFKSIRRITRLPLSPISVLIGPNGSGKSNFIGLFSLLREIRDGRLQQYVAKSGGADRMLHFGSMRAHPWPWAPVLRRTRIGCREAPRSSAP